MPQVARRVRVYIVVKVVNCSESMAPNIYREYLDLPGYASGVAAHWLDMTGLGNP